MKSFARIHLANLINFGIVPLTFEKPADYDQIEQDDELEMTIGDLRSDVVLNNKTKNKTFKLEHTLSHLDSRILKAGGKLLWVRTQIQEPR